MNRRKFMGTAGLALASAALPRGLGAAEGEAPLLTKKIPASGEPLPVIGMGTWITFNVGDDPELLAHRTRILRAFFEGGGGMIDSSPMYGSAEAVLGHCLSELGYPEGLFSATKVWTSSTEEGREQVADSKRLWGVETLDLQQVHNLVNWRAHLETLRALKERGGIRYVGVTTSHGRRHGELERVMKTGQLDFVQLTYNIANCAVEERLLPLAHERGVAVIANRPYGGGREIDRMQREKLPPWAGEVGAKNWPEFLLKFIVSHPAVTCAIPATSKVQHLRENMGACRGPLPDAAGRERMLRYVRSL